MSQISITKIKPSLPDPSPLWGEGKGDGRLGIWKLENWDLFGICLPAGRQGNWNLGFLETIAEDIERMDGVDS